MFNRGRMIGGLDLDFEYHGASINTANQNSYTFSSFPIGTPNTNRMVVVAFNMSTGGATNSQGGSVTIGGVSATSVGGGTVIYGNSGVAYLKVPSGTNANIVVTRTNTENTPGHCGIAVYSFNTSTTSPLDTGVYASFSTTTYTLEDIACAEGGVVIFSTGWAPTTNSANTTWNGVDSAVLNVNAAVENYRRMFGYVLPTETSSIRDLVMTLGASTSGPRMAVVSFSLD